MGNAADRALAIVGVSAILPDAEAAREHDVRVIDESGEDYLYPADWFVPIDVPDEVEASLLEAS